MIAIIAGFVGGNITQAPALANKISDRFTDKTDPANFWSMPAIPGYGKIHYVDTAAFKPGGDLSNKVVFQINRSEGEMTNPNPGLERVARVTNLDVAAGYRLTS